MVVPDQPATKFTAPVVALIVLPAFKATGFRLYVIDVAFAEFATKLSDHAPIHLVEVAPFTNTGFSIVGEQVL